MYGHLNPVYQHWIEHFWIGSLLSLLTTLLLLLFSSFLSKYTCPRPYPYTFVFASLFIFCFACSLSPILSLFNLAPSSFSCAFFVFLLTLLPAFLSTPVSACPALPFSSPALLFLFLFLLLCCLILYVQCDHDFLSSSPLKPCPCIDVFSSSSYSLTRLPLRFLRCRLSSPTHEFDARTLWLCTNLRLTRKL